MEMGELEVKSKDWRIMWPWGLPHQPPLKRYSRRSNKNITTLVQEGRFIETDLAYLLP